MLCGITMAPSMPRATRMLAPSTDGMTHFGAAAAQSGLHEKQLDDIARGDDREKDDDHAFEAMVLLPEDGDEDDADGQRRPEPQRQPEQQVEAERGTEVLGQVGGRCRQGRS